MIQIRPALCEFIHSTNDARTVPELTDLFLEYLRPYGLHYFILSRLSCDTTYQKERNHGLVSNYPDEWLKHYHANHYVEHDPVYRTALTARKPFTWHNARAQARASETAERVMGEARDCKLYDGVGLSIYGPLGETTGIGLASSAGRLDYHKDTLSEILALATQFYQVFFDLTSSDSSRQDVRLTQREREILGWLARGKSVNDISDILDISEGTVRFHSQNIYKKMDVCNGRLAVAKAIRMGLVNPY